MAETSTEPGAGSTWSGARRPGRLRVALGALLCAACGGGGGGEGPAPVPRAVVPDTGYAGLPTAVPVRIEGDGFDPRVNGSGQADTRHRAWLGDTELTDVTWIDAHTLSATVPAGLAPGVLPLRVENPYGRQGTLPDAFTSLAVPASLAASITASRSSAGLGQPFDVTFTVKNGGTGAADLGQVSPSQAGPAASCSAPSPSAALTLEAGATQVYTWTCAGSAAGLLSLDASVHGTDVASGAPLEAAAVSAARIDVQPPAVLAIALAVDGDPTAVQVGQAFTLRATVSNQGGAAATVSSLTVTPEEAGCGAPTPALPVAVTGGTEVAFALTCAAATAGALAPAVSARGQDANTGLLVTARATLSSLLTAQPPAALTATVAATPTTFAVGQATSVTFYVTNGPGLPTAQVTSVAPWATGTGVAACNAVTVPPGTAVPAGATQVFSWTCTASQAGDLLLGGSVNFTANGVPASASPVVPVAATVTPP